MREIVMYINVERIPESEGGGYTAYSLSLGEYYLSGDGETVAEAIIDFAKRLKEEKEERK